EGHGEMHAEALFREEGPRGAERGERRGRRRIARPLPVPEAGRRKHHDAFLSRPGSISGRSQGAKSDISSSRICAFDCVHLSAASPIGAKASGFSRKARVFSASSASSFTRRAALRLSKSSQMVMKLYITGP